MSANPLDQVILGFSPHDPFTIRDACEGVQIFGCSGSGKTSGSGRLLATSYLRQGFGGLVLTAKVDETDLWRQYAAETGRTNDLVIFGAKEPQRFNLLEYEWAHAGDGAGHSRNMLELFLTLAEIADRKGSKHAGSNETYWQNELKKLVGNAIEILRLAVHPITFQSIYDVVITAPQTEEECTTAAFQKSSFCFEIGKLASKRLNARNKKDRLSKSDADDLAIATKYWMREFPRLDPRPRSSIVGNFTGLVDPFLRGVLRELFSTTTTVIPDDTFDGKIILLDLPQKQFHEVGVYAQVLFKYSWQRAVERRKIAPHSRPVFLWADESQHFANEHDTHFQTTARSSRVCTVYLTQNLPNYHLTLGGSGGPLTDSLLGNLSTKIFHNNTCVATNKYASELFASTWRPDSSSSGSLSDGKLTTGQSQSEKLKPEVLPHEFTTLAKGGTPNNFLVEGIVHQGGKTFRASNANALRVIFNQRMP